MPFYIYILYSQSTDRYYTGYCENLNSRLEKHNHHSTPSTKSGIPWKLVYTEEYRTKNEAILRERQIKSMKSRKYIKNIINTSGYTEDQVVTN